MLKILTWLKKRNLIRYTPLIYALFDTLCSYFKIWQVNQGAVESGVDVSSAYTNGILSNSFLLISMAIIMAMKNHKGRFLAFIIGLLIINNGFQKLFFEWHDVQNMGVETVLGKASLMLSIWWNYHNGAQEITRLIIVIGLTIYSIYSAFISLKRGKTNQSVEG